MVNEWPAKGPNERLDYAFNWAEFIALMPGATISSATMTASTITGDEDPLTIETPTVSASNLVSAFITGGTPKARYTVTCTIQIAVPGEISPAVAEWATSLFIRAR